METAEPACRLKIIFPLIPSCRLIHPTIMFDYRNFQPVPQLIYTVLSTRVATRRHDHEETNGVAIVCPGHRLLAAREQHLSCRFHPEPSFMVCGDWLKLHHRCA